MSSELITHTSDASFKTDVLEAGTPVLVDYWAEWCGPCKAIAPILDEVSKDYNGKLRVAKMNVDENRDVPAKFGIRGIPTLMLFKNGQLAVLESTLTYNSPSVRCPASTTPGLLPDPAGRTRARSLPIDPRPPPGEPRSGPAATPISAPEASWLRSAARAPDSHRGPCPRTQSSAPPRPRPCTSPN
jgi:thioredoxin 1